MREGWKRSVENTPNQGGMEKKEVDVGVNP